MPTLQIEPYVWPETLLEGDAAQRESQSWLALHTRPRAEKALARRLLKDDVSFFLPLYARQRKAQRRSVTSYLPLFSSYVFLWGDDGARSKALETNLVVNCLDVPDCQQERTWGDLRRLHSLMQRGASMYPEERLRPGVEVRVTDGPLKGFCGTINRRGKKLTFYVEMHFLQRGASVEIHESMVEPTQAVERAKAAGTGLGSSH